MTRRLIGFLYITILFFNTIEISCSELDFTEIYESEDFENLEENDFDEELSEDSNEDSNEINHPFHKALFKHSSVNSADSNQAMLTLEAGPSATVANCVNAISGDYFESQIPLTVPGPLPLVVQCSYCSSEKAWHFQHMPKLEVGHSQGENHLYASYLDDNGSGMTYRAYVNDLNPLGISGRKLTIPDALFKKGLTNCGSGEISGQTNWKNSEISLSNHKKKYCYKLRHGSNIERIFTKYKHRKGSKGAPLGAFHLTQEKHPNGNCLLYRYHKKDLSEVKAVNKFNQCLGQINLSINNPYDKSNNPRATQWYGSCENTVFVGFKDEQKNNITHIIPTAF